MAAFVVKMGAIMMLIATALVVESLLSGAMSVWGALALLPAGVLLTGRLFKLAVRKRRRRARRAALHNRARVQAHAAAAPALRVVQASRRPDGPRVA